MEADVPRPSQVEPNDPTQSQSGGERNAPGPAHERSAPRAASLESRAALAYQYACQGRLYDLTKVLEGGGGLTDAKALLRWRLEPEYHRTLLMGAASVGEGAVANYLLLLLMLVTADQEHGLAKAVNEQDETGSTALALACMGAAGGEEEGEGLVSALLEAGADVSLVDNEGYSALHMAAAFGRVEACRLVLDHVASPLQLTHLVNAQASAWHETPLWLAVKEKHTHVAALLLGKGAKVGADVEGLVRVRGLRSHGATGAQVMAKLVLGHNHITGQEDEAEDEEERHSSGDEGYESGEGEEWEGSSDSSDDDTQAARAVKAFHHVCGVGAVADVKWMLTQHGVSVLHAVDETRLGMTPLHRAAEAGHEQVVCCLLDAGADVEAMDQHGASPLGVAAMEGHAHVASLLLTQGHARVDSRDQDGDTPAMVAACCGWVEVLDVLLQGGADVRAVTQGASTKRWTALHYAARHGEDGAAKLLVAQGAQVGQRDEKGRTAADLAFLYDHTTLGHWLEAAAVEQHVKSGVKESDRGAGEIEAAVKESRKSGVKDSNRSGGESDVVTPRDVTLHLHSESEGSVLE